MSPRQRKAECGACSPRTANTSIPDTTTPTPADIDEAGSLLDAAGWTGRDGDGYRADAGGSRLTIKLLATIPTYPLDDVLEAWQAEIRQNAGAEVELEYVENALVYDLLAGNDYEAFPRQVGGLDLSLQLNRAFGSTTPDLKYGQIDGITIGSIVAGSKLADPQVDQWLVQATKATDEATRQGLFDQVTRFISSSTAPSRCHCSRTATAWPRHPASTTSPRSSILPATSSAPRRTTSQSTDDGTI